MMGKAPWPGLTADLLFMEDIFPVCHPRLLEGERKLSHPEALRHHTLLHTIHRRHDWARWLNDYYNSVRTHRSLNKDAPVSRPVQRTGMISSRAILGGLHRHYARV
jgi:DNA-binding transcriptional LysR family regulator